jgi:hypothetical protein
MKFNAQICEKKGTFIAFSSLPSTPLLVFMILSVLIAIRSLLQMMSANPMFAAPEMQQQMRQAMPQLMQHVCRYTVALNTILHTF